MTSIIRKLKNSMCEERENWVVKCTQGSQGKAISGYIATKNCPSECNPAWFPDYSTAIIGKEAKPLGSCSCWTEIKWEIDIPLDLIMSSVKHYIVIATKREFGGLHSRERGARVQIWINGKQKEDFSLKFSPEGYSDYFYRQQLSSSVPLQNDIEYCKTVYVWQLEKRDLDLSSGHQIISVRIDPESTWDIDYVALQLKQIQNKWFPKVKTAIFLLAAICAILSLFFMLILFLLKENNR